jgi:hypothetical protein
MADIQLEIQGQDAVAATEELFSISGLSGSWKTEGEADKEGTLITIGTIVAIVGVQLRSLNKFASGTRNIKKASLAKRLRRC